MNKFKLAALTLSVIGTSALSLNTFANNFEDTANIDINAEVIEMIQIEGLKTTINLDMDRDYDGVYLYEWNSFAIGKQGVNSAQKPFSLTVTGDDGSFALTNEEGDSLPLHVAFSNDRDGEKELAHGVTQNNLHTDLAIGSGQQNSHFFVGVYKDDLRFANPGNYTTSLTMVVSAE